MIEASKPMKKDQVMKKINNISQFCFFVTGAIEAQNAVANGLRRALMGLNIKLDDIDRQMLTDEIKALINSHIMQIIHDGRQ